MSVKRPRSQPLAMRDYHCLDLLVFTLAAKLAPECMLRFRCATSRKPPGLLLGC